MTLYMHILSNLIRHKPGNCYVHCWCTRAVLYKITISDGLLRNGDAVSDGTELVTYAYRPSVVCQVDCSEQITPASQRLSSCQSFSSHSSGLCPVDQKTSSQLTAFSVLSSPIAAHPSPVPLIISLTIAKKTGAHRWDIPHTSSGLSINKALPGAVQFGLVSIGPFDASARTVSSVRLKSVIVAVRPRLCDAANRYCCLRQSSSRPDPAIAGSQIHNSSTVWDTHANVAPIGWLEFHLDPSTNAPSGSAVKCWWTGGRHYESGKATPAIPASHYNVFPM